MSHNIIETRFPDPAPPWTDCPTEADMAKELKRLVCPEAVQALVGVKFKVTIWGEVWPAPISTYIYLYTHCLASEKVCPVEVLTFPPFFYFVCVCFSIVGILMILY